MLTGGERFAETKARYDSRDDKNRKGILYIMTRFTIISDDRREIDRARSILSKSYNITEEKTPKTSEKQRFRSYLFVVPKEKDYPEYIVKQFKNGDVKRPRSK